MSVYANENTPVTSRRQWFGMLAGPVVWMTHFVFVYMVDEFVCKIDFFTTELLGLSAAAILVLLSTVATLAITGYAGWSSYRIWRSTAVEDQPEWQRSREEARLRFMGLSGVLVSSMFLLLTVGLTVAVIVLSPC